MTACAKGDAENPGKRVKQKSGLNRVISNVPPYKVREQLSYKAEKTGSKVIAIDPKYTSLTCDKCGHIDKENSVSQTEFRCMKCLHVDHADRNAAFNILMRADILAGVSARRKSPRRSTVPGKLSGKLTDLATIKASGNCFQPAKSSKCH